VTNKVIGMLGLARKSGKLIVGFDALTTHLKKNRIPLVIIAKDASDKGKQNMIFYCEKQETNYLEFSSKEELGRILNRLEVSFVGIKDRNMAEYVVKQSK